MRSACSSILPDRPGPASCVLRNVSSSCILRPSSRVNHLYAALSHGRQPAMQATCHMPRLWGPSACLLRAVRRLGCGEPPPTGSRSLLRRSICGPPHTPCRLCLSLLLAWLVVHALPPDGLCGASALPAPRPPRRLRSASAAPSPRHAPLDLHLGGMRRHRRLDRRRVLQRLLRLRLGLERVHRHHVAAAHALPAEGG